jgi:histidine ammonia-lyase
VAGVGPDRYLAPEIEAVRGMVADGTLVQAAEAAVGELE